MLLGAFCATKKKLFTVVSANGQNTPMVWARDKVAPERCMQWLCCGIGADRSRAFRSCTAFFSPADLGIFTSPKFDLFPLPSVLAKSARIDSVYYPLPPKRERDQ